jgi:hypothetical protein
MIKNRYKSIVKRWQNQNSKCSLKKLNNKIEADIERQMILQNFPHDVTPNTD